MVIMKINEDEIYFQIRVLIFLQDNIRRKILDLLFDSGPQGTSFKSLKERLNIPPTSLAYHLNVMVKEKVIEKEFLNIEGRRDYSYYNLTKETENAYPRALAYLGSHSAGTIQKKESDQELWIIPLRLGPRVISLDQV
jgi:DNA-binding HxlR family transcriptional regulator